ncbi:unnamed protein product, partial [Cuscuta europaea]
MMAAWGDSSDDDEEEGEKSSNHVGLCLMANSDEESDQESFEVNLENFLSKFDSLPKTKVRKIFKRLTIELNQNLSENENLKSQITELESKLEETTRAKLRLETRVGELIDEKLKYSEVVLEQDNIICSLKLDSMNQQVDQSEKLLSKIPNIGVLIEHLNRLEAERQDFKNKPEYQPYSTKERTRSRPYSRTEPSRYKRKENETAGLGYVPRKTQINQKSGFQNQSFNGNRTRGQTSSWPYQRQSRTGPTWFVKLVQRHKTGYGQTPNREFHKRDKDFYGNWKTKYVDTYDSRICGHCGKVGHLRYQCHSRQ